MTFKEAESKMRSGWGVRLPGWDRFSYIYIELSGDYEKGFFPIYFEKSHLWSVPFYSYPNLIKEFESKDNWEYVKVKYITNN